MRFYYTLMRLNYKLSKQVENEFKKLLFVDKDQLVPCKRILKSCSQFQTE